MNIIVPIHLEALRVAPSSQQAAKTALYDFQQLGQNPASSIGDLIASNRFETAQTSLGIEPGVHLHWTLPRAYTRGVQDEETGSIRYPIVPNRWLIVRYFKDNRATSNNTRIRIWVLESDAHSGEQDSTNSPTSIPWMTDPSDLQGLKGNFVGRRVDLSGSWTEPTSTLQATAPGEGDDVGFLGNMFQATYGYGETFTAFYPNCANVLGIYDTLDDYFSNPQSQLENNTDFSASYTVMGWVSSPSDDECNIVIQQAVAAYSEMSGDKPDFPSYLASVFQQNLSWSLSSFEAFTPSNASATQGILAGTLSDITWKIANPGNPTYPSPLPSSEGVQVSIGNNTPEALSAYISKLEADNAFLASGQGVDSSVEWLLNALQFNQLHELSAGDKGVGQLQEFLHSTAFSARDSGFQWEVRQKDKSETGQSQTGDNDVPLPPYLGKILAELNDKQHALDASRGNIATRQQQLFYDWTHHISEINTHVIDGSGTLDEDKTGAFLTTGLFELYPEMQTAGLFVGAGLPSSPYTPSLDQFSIDIPADFPTEFEMHLPSYKFNTAYNAASGDVVTALLELGFGLDQSAGLMFPSSIVNLTSAQALLKLAEVGGKDSDDYIASAKLLVTQAGTELGLAVSALADLSGNSGISVQETSIDQANTTWSGVVDPHDGVFAQYLKYTPDAGKAPLPAGETYTGLLNTASAGDTGTWASASDGFVGIKSLMDSFTGQDGAASQAVDASLAALYLGYAYFFVNSQFVFKSSAGYYLQMCETEVQLAQAAAKSGSNSLEAAAEALAGNALTGLISNLSTMVHTNLQAILSDLDREQPDVSAALSEIEVMLAPAGSAEPSIPGFQLIARGDDWASLRNGIEDAREAVTARLSATQQVSIWNTFLYGKVSSLFDLTAAPADAYQVPTEPVVLLAQDKTSGEDLLAPFARNGKAEIVPCRLTAEIVADASTTFPPPVNAITTSIDTKITGLSADLQALAEEAYLLSPELSTAVSKDDLEAAATENKALHYNATNDVVLQDAPSPLTGKLPYYIAYNWRSDLDPFIPLFIWWSVNYRFSQNFEHSSESYGQDFLNQFELGQYEVELQPTAEAMSNFGPGGAWSNGFSFHGLISLSSAATTSLTSQIQTYCTSYLNYDPSKGPPQQGIDNYDEALKFYDAYQDYKTRDVLSQGLSGFNAGLVTRAQELQIPINIPQNWTGAKGYTLDEFWPTQLLHAQSTNWPVDWNSEGPNTDAYSQGASKVFFNPLRAGFLEIEKITLVDSFGRFVDIANPTPYSISENMTADQIPPNTAHSTYLAPRLVQPSRVNFDWIAAETASGIESFFESGAQPSTSPICGWLWPNHLDDSLMLYDGGGRPMGSLRTRETELHWFPVPGETTEPGAVNRDQMVLYFTSLAANQVFVDYVTKYLYPDTGASTTTKFQSFLEVLRKSQAFIVSPSQQQDADLAVLMGRPLVITQSQISLSQQGIQQVGLNGLTYPEWNKDGPQFTNNASQYIPYNFENFDTGKVSGLDVKCRVGMSEIQRTGGSNIPYFDDGVAGYFLGETWDTLYTPVDMKSVDGITSVAAAGSTPLSLQPNGSAQLLTVVMDPTAAIHVTTGLIPAKSLAIPPNIYSKVLARLQITFLTAPILKAQTPPALPLPPESGYGWSWVEVGGSDLPIKPAQGATNVTFPQTPQMLVDGWLKLQKQSN